MLLDKNEVKKNEFNINSKTNDFIIKEESDKGEEGLMNLISIESPGLTTAPAIAQMVRDIVLERLN